MSDNDILNLIHAKVEKISEDLQELKTDQAVMKEDVKYHVKRSDMLEELFVDMKEKDIEPLKADMSRIHGAVKVIMALATIAMAVWPILHYILKK